MPSGGPREAAYREAGIAVFGPGEAAAAAGLGRGHRAHPPRRLCEPARDGADAGAEAAGDAGGGDQRLRPLRRRRGREADRRALPAEPLVRLQVARLGRARPRWARRCTCCPTRSTRTGSARVPDAARGALRAGLGVPPGRFLFGRIGQPHPAKWSPRMLDAFAEVLRPRARRRAAAGRGAGRDRRRRWRGCRRAVRARIVSLPVTASDRRLSECLTAMDGFLHLSRIGESFGMVLCEAMLCGVPVVTLSTPLKDNSQLEVVGHGVGGIVALTAGGGARGDGRPDAGRGPLRAASGRRRGVGSRALRRAISSAGGRWQIYRGASGRGGRPAMPVARPAMARGALGAAASGGGRAGGDALAFRLLHMPAIYRGYLSLGGAGGVMARGAARRAWRGARPGSRGSRPSTSSCRWRRCPSWCAGSGSRAVLASTRC